LDRGGCFHFEAGALLQHKNVFLVSGDGQAGRKISQLPHWHCFTRRPIFTSLAPEFWDAIVSGLGNVWEENVRRTRRRLVQTQSSSLHDVTASLRSGSDAGTGDGGGYTPLQTAGGTSAQRQLNSLTFWLSGDDEEHASGRHGGTAEFSGVCDTLPGSCNVAPWRSTNFAAFETGTLEQLHSFLFHVGSKGSENGKPHRTTRQPCVMCLGNGSGLLVLSVGNNCGGKRSVVSLSSLESV
jgi:hypothetical protein